MTNLLIVCFILIGNIGFFMVLVTLVGARAFVNKEGQTATPKGGWPINLIPMYAGIGMMGFASVNLLATLLWLATH